MSAEETMATAGRSDQSADISALAAALAKAQLEIRSAAKDSNNPHFGSKYADLASVRDACREPLAKNGIAVIQQVGTDGGEAVVRTVLAHSSGQWMSCEARVKPERPGAQGFGSAITYLRRYSLAGMAGVAPDEDDDGEGAMGRGQQAKAAPKRETRQEQAGTSTLSPPPKAEAKADKPSQATPSQIKALTDALTDRLKLIEAEGRANWVTDRVGRKLGSPRELTALEAEQLLTWCHVEALFRATGETDPKAIAKHVTLYFGSWVGRMPDKPTDVSFDDVAVVRAKAIAGEFPQEGAA